ncbi:uncharacterized protein TNCV_4262211 [Trichonephila clavipes]|nr:uncharacterized protein TNCV_4262211 [Trichonephila clavipes]
MKNAVSGRTKTDLSALYDELEGKLRSLESLGRTQEKYGDFLTPLSKGKRWCSWQNPVLELLSEKDSPTESVKPTELTTASALASSVKSSVLSEKKICGFTSKIEDKRILNELKNKEIILSDLNCKETEIGLLIGADNIGKLTGNLIEFDSGLTAIETKLGWTVIGKVCSNDKNVMLTTSSLHVRNVCVSVKELWELDVLGITDPLLNENTKENFEFNRF